MTEDARKLAIATLAEHYKPRDLTPAQIRIYEKALQVVPVALLEPMVTRTIATRHGYGGLPQVHELLEDAEYVRLELQRANPHTPCAACEDHAGWIDTGDERYKRCSCWHAHKAKLARLGVGHTPLALPAGQARPIGTEEA